ncbi:MAG TPA: hypothetical protein VIY49_11150 [Bryobacteraceae bacterium]
MLLQFLVPETEARQDGTGAAVALERAGAPVLVTLGIDRILEQQTLHVSVWGSSDGQQWHSLVNFPRKSYCGVYSLLLDLGAHPDIRFLRAQWKMGSWANEYRNPLFGFQVTLDSEPRLSQAAAR